LRGEMQRTQALVMMVSNAKIDMSVKQADAISKCFFDSNQQMIGDYYKVKDAE